MSEITLETRCLNAAKFLWRTYVWDFEDHAAPVDFGAIVAEDVRKVLLDANYIAANPLNPDLSYITQEGAAWLGFPEPIIKTPFDGDSK